MKSWLIAAAERAVKTAAQVAILTLGARQVDAWSADWWQVGGMALGGFVLSVLTSLASLGGPGRVPASSEEAGAKP